MRVVPVPKRSEVSACTSLAVCHWETHTAKLWLNSHKFRICATECNSSQTPTAGTSQVLHEGWRPVSLSKLDKAPQIELDKTLSKATSRKGYRMVGIVHQCHV